MGFSGANSNSEVSITMPYSLRRALKWGAEHLCAIMKPLGMQLAEGAMKDHVISSLPLHEI